ncbi:MAG: hypothetical protein ACYC8V_14300, partial [Caulobacteraceae bacterium]
AALTGRSAAAMSRWRANGGEATLAAYGITDRAVGSVPTGHIRWLSGLPLSTADRYRIFVHAGVAPRVPFARQSEEILLWIRGPFLKARSEDLEAHVVHGHTPVWAGKPDPSLPELLAQRTNLDTGAFATGVLTIGVFDADERGGPVEVLTARGPPQGCAVAGA